MERCFEGRFGDDGAQGYIFVEPMQGVYLGVLIVLTVLAVNFVGEGLREAFDPRLAGRLLLTRST